MLKPKKKNMPTSQNFCYFTKTVIFLKEKKTKKKTCRYNKGQNIIKNYYSKRSLLKLN